MRRAVLAGLFLAAAGAVAQDKKSVTPKILYPIPLVVAPGPKVKVVLRGQKLDGVNEVVASDPAVSVKVIAARKASGKGRDGDTEVEVELNLPEGTEPGLTLTAVGSVGRSAPYPLPLPDGLPRVAEVEDNGSFRKPQPVPVPAAVDGSIRAARDVDVFRFDGTNGQTLRVEVWAARWGSPLDATLAVSDADGRALAAADDTAGADPGLTVTLPRDGAYLVTVADAHDQGGPGFGYRLVIRPAD